nr:MAG: internal scaffolding protein [Microvirus sp.]
MTTTSTTKSTSHFSTTLPLTSTSTLPLRTLYDGLQPSISLATSESSFEDSLTHQSFKDECDINTIISRIDTEGFLTDSGRPPQYFDASLVPDFQSAQNQMAYAQQSFDALPAHVRDYFRNDPARFVKFFEDPKNAQQAIDLGLAEYFLPPEKLSPQEELTRRARPPEGDASSSSSKGKKTTSKGGDSGDEGGN